ncbi:hypothetical protein CANARDRAFT_201006 [[Candida] arabinofermentans NRRL YB-2248]|uniref:OPT superfamily oligopeptide transporter n=1 Tax=[Candida] arabinofermentans NRRL YB-2248 TaxID=983967 RepID=A0A1E4SXV0_9ASCO|nr:hypothetical protein CANARDRAFT_201006 [[Candida] arabinofermentans NRRL YB-2248]
MQSQSQDVREDDLKYIPSTVVEQLQLADNSYTPRSLHDHEIDNNLLTFRYFLLSTLFVIPGAFIDTMNSYRTTSAPYSILFVQFLAYPIGKYLSKVLPNKQIKLVPGLVEFNLNPHPWSIKESVLITLTAASGATGNQGTAGISLAAVYYNEKMHPIIAILFMYSIVWTGYSFAAIARNLVLYDPQFIWPQAVMQTAMFKFSAKGQGLSQMQIFIIGLVGMFLWELLPEYVFPMTSSLAFVCYMKPHSKSMNFLGSGLGGLGFLNVTLDWSNITSSVMLSPYWTIVLQFIGFVSICWIALPFFKWFDGGKYSMGLMDNRVLLGNGTVYPTLDLVTKDLKFNETAYELYGPVHLGYQRVMNIFFDFAAYTSAIMWIICFGRDDLKKTWLRMADVLKSKSSSSNIGNEPNERSFLLQEHSNIPDHQLPKHSMSSKFNDRINKDYSVYEDVPIYWFLILFLASFTILSSILLTTTQLFIPFKTYIVALSIGAITVTPMSYLFASSNFQLAIGTVNELIYGLMIQTPFFSTNSKGEPIKHPCGAAIYGAISGNTWYRAQYLLQDQKIGMYNRIPPKAVFFSQLFGDIIGVPFNYIALRWVLKNKMEYLRGEKQDPLRQWTGQSLVGYNSNTIQYVLLGPKRLFALYPILPCGFLAGMIVPLIIFICWKKRILGDTLRWFNVTIIFATMSRFYGNISTGYFTQFLIGTGTMYYLFNYKRKIFKKYNYVLAAAFDTGFNISCLCLFFWFSKEGAKSFPNWWGNDAISIEKCYSLEK